MALTKEEREARIKLNEMLDRFAVDGKTLFDDEQVIDEAVEEKISNISGLEDLIRANKERLIYVGVESLDCLESEDVNISLFFMSTNNVKVSDDNNLLSIAFSVDREYWSHTPEELRIYMSDIVSTKIERFIGLPIVSEKEDAITAKALVERCDAVQFYKLYLEDALALIRKHFPCSYNMFSGPNLSKHLEYKIISRDGRIADNTLYVAYDSMRKKFKFSYNPKFILESAINEWMLNGSRYKSLRDCYCYLLAFSITHEMLHIIHHNTVSDTGIDDTRLSAVDGNVANTIMDSFINCKLAKGYRGCSSIYNYGGLAPILSDGVDSKVSVRVEHNKGFKKFNDVRELVDTLGDILLKDIGAPGLRKEYMTSGLGGDNEAVRDLSMLEGADIFITVDVSPQFNELRAGTNIFQTYVNDTIKAITDGKAFDVFSKVSDEEKRSDLNIIPNGSLVLVKGGDRNIGVVISYDENTDRYVINKAKLTGVRHPEDDINVCIPVYEDSGDKLGTYDRLSICPYNPEKDAYVDNAGMEKKTEISQEDLDNLKNKMDGAVSGNMPSPEGKPVKPLNVGDIVWVRKAQKFGRIVSIDNGIFNIEEMVERPCKEIDRKTVY